MNLDMAPNQPPQHNHSHTHTHDDGHKDDHDHGDEQLEQLVTIGICGVFGVIAIFLSYPSVLSSKSGSLSYILAEPFHKWVLVGGAVLLAMTVLRAIAVWRYAAPHSHHHHADGEECLHPSHAHGEDDHGHAHGGIYWRVVILMFPIVLCFLGLPNQGYSKERVNALLGTDTELDAGSLSEVAAKDGGGYFEFADLASASHDEFKRQSLEGTRATIRGQFKRISDRSFTLYMLKMTCCAADTIPLKARIVTDAALNAFTDDEWVEVTGRLQFVPVPGQAAEYLPLLRSELKDVKRWKQ